jgi:hypothetical protein
MTEREPFFRNKIVYFKNKFEYKVNDMREE